MTPQMQQILEKFEEDWGFFKMKCTKYLPNGVRLSAGYITEKDVKKEIQKACAIYAQSIIETPIKITVTNGDPIMQERWDGIMNNIKSLYLEEIKQDSIDLPTN